MIVKSLNNQYVIGKLVGNASNYRLYLCEQNETNRQCLLQIAANAADNGALDRTAYILRELKKHSDELEEEYSQVKTNPDSFLNYDLGFPEILDSFICKEQGDRRINILAFRSVDNPQNMLPLNIITDTYGLRVDLRTSAWIMGKTLKMLNFAHNSGVVVNLMTARNILVERDQHYVVIFDWSEAQLYFEEIPIPYEERRKDISHATQAIIKVLGGNHQKGHFPDDYADVFKDYTSCLLMLARGNESNAQRAHKAFYKLIRSYWKKEFYPFTTKPLI